MRVFSLLPALFAAALPVMAGDHQVSDPEALDKAIRAARPGDVIVMRAGEWPDTQIRFKGQGTADAPVTLRAERPGATVLTGASSLRIGGEHLVVEGLWFKDPDPSVGDSLEFRMDSKNLARHCRVTQCAVTLAPEKADKAAKESRWLGLYGRENRVDHCLFQGKASKGTTLVVWLGGQNEGRHVIEDNWFGPREKLGKNGGETIRVGDSSTSMQTAACQVRGNVFHRCNGEAECISNKSCGNIYRENVFLEVSGTLTLRHGNGCLVENNRFFGNHASGTGGIRIIGEDHVVRDNYLENLAGDDVRCGLTFMMGLPDSPLNGYFQVKRALVENNAWINCKHSILIGMEGDKVPGKPSLPPVDCILRGNKVFSPKSAAVEARCDLDGVRWEGNLFAGKELGIPDREGIVFGGEVGVSRPVPPAPGSAGPSWWQH